MISAPGTPHFGIFKQFHFDILKIDGQFIRNIAHDPDNQVITQALVAIGQQFDMFTVAECVEPPAEAAWLQSAWHRLSAGLSLWGRPHLHHLGKCAQIRHLKTPITSAEVVLRLDLPHRSKCNRLSLN